MNKKRGLSSELSSILIAAIGAVWYYIPVSLITVALFMFTLTMVFLSLVSHSLLPSLVVSANKIK